MSEANEAVVRVLVEAFLRHDTAVMEALMDPEVEWDASELRRSFPDMSRNEYRGQEGTREFWGAWISSWKDIQFDYELRAAGDMVAVLISNQRQWGRHSDAETRFPDYAWVYTVREGRITRGRFHGDHASALDAVGLEP